jgi:hypothetical protein
LLFSIAELFNRLVVGVLICDSEMEDIQWTTAVVVGFSMAADRSLEIEGRSELNESREGTTVRSRRTGLIVCSTSANWNEKAQAKRPFLDAKINDAMRPVDTTDVSNRSRAHTFVIVRER